MSAINADAGQATDDAEQQVISCWCCDRARTASDSPLCFCGQDLAHELEKFLWPEGTHARSGRSWESLELATEDITRIMQTQGCRGLKIKNQTYLDAARTRVKKRVFKCPCSGVYTQRGVETMAVGGRARQTSTKKTNCGVYINVNVDAHTGEWLSDVGGNTSSTHLSPYALWSAGMARVTTSSHLHNHALAGPDTQATAVQQELSAALTESIQEWAQCGLATTAIRQLVQLELGLPFLTNATKKKVRYCNTDLHVASVSPCACGRVSHRSRIWCRKQPVQKSNPLMPTSSFRLWQSSQVLFSTTG